MNETLHWSLAGGLACAILLSLGFVGPEPDIAVPTEPRDAATDEVGEATVLALAWAPSQNAALAEAYMRIAQRQPEEPGASGDWLVRHQMTVKGLAARQGEKIDPEAPQARGLTPTLEIALIEARQDLIHWQQHVAQLPRLPNQSALYALAAEAQAQYDWWLFSAEAAWSQASLEDSQTTFDSALQAFRSALATAPIAQL